MSDSELTEHAWVHPRRIQQQGWGAVGVEEAGTLPCLAPLQARTHYEQHC